MRWGEEEDARRGVRWEIGTDDAAQTAKEAANPSEKRFDPSKQRLLTYGQLRAELEEEYALTEKQLQKRWDELGQLQ